MISFSQYMLCEEAEAPQPFQHYRKTNGAHVYRFHLGDDTEHFRVNIQSDVDSSGYVTFEDPKGRYRQTGDQGTRSVKILSTVHKILQHHAATHPGINKMVFTSDNDEPSRVKLYSRYTSKYGGENKKGNWHTYHTIPTKNLI